VSHKRIVLTLLDHVMSAKCNKITTADSSVVNEPWSWVHLNAKQHSQTVREHEVPSPRNGTMDVLMMVSLATPELCLVKKSTTNKCLLNMWMKVQWF